MGDILAEQCQAAIEKGDDVGENEPDPDADLQQGGKKTKRKTAPKAKQKDPHEKGV